MADVARNAVQDKDMVKRRGNTEEEQADDLRGEDKMLVLEEQPVRQNAPNERSLIVRKRTVGFVCRCYRAELRTEIEVVAVLPEQPSAREEVTERALSRASRAQQED